jgi:hypothetical protein
MQKFNMRKAKATVRNIFNTKTKAASIVLMGLLCVSIATALLMSEKQKSSHGKVKQIGVDLFIDHFGETIVSDIDFGVLEHGSVNYFDCYMKSTSKHIDVAVTMTVSNWNPPEAEADINITWNCTGIILAPDEIVAVRFTCTVAASPAISDFSNTITIIATEV